ncbi:hypothetical protein FNV43_RR18375 [Rhamnella rubrinervis]|uniref:Uncharacterized protein n=1 Tax=Rhamnella rubrinervis TaxID=2594499 RepID=A0A8K0GSV6_9ROSA|nr:hypothetical protein FNV43_RR18375 [Rhamnella rubrinervis]
MGPELEMKPKTEGPAKVSFRDENRNIHQVLEDQSMPCMSNCKENTADMEVLSVEQTAAPNGSENEEELNITDSVYPSNIGLVESECQDATENSQSSSFGDTITRVENSSVLDIDEVDSRLCAGNASLFEFDQYSEAFRMRKRKVTAHWRKYIRPLMWRCKWIELQINELQSQASKYDRELAEYDERKEFEFGRFMSENFNSKSLPFSCQMQRNKVMKRKKRKRVEETTDVASYMSHHNLFSCYEKKRSATDGVKMEDDFDNRGIVTCGNGECGINDGESSFQFQDGDSSLEEILWKMEVIQSQVCKLKTRIEKVLIENPANYSSNFGFLGPCDAMASSALNPASPPEMGNRLLVESQHTSDHNMRDLLMLESAVPSHGQVAPYPDMIESTDHPQVGGLFENIVDGMLINNKAGKEGWQDFEKVRDQLLEKSQVSTEEQKSNPAVLNSEADMPPKNSEPNGESSVKAASSTKPDKPDYPWNTRYRGRRKPGSTFK